MSESYPAPPYLNGYAQLRFEALMGAMRESKISATELEIVTRADSLLYLQYRLIAQPDGSAKKDTRSKEPDRRHQLRNCRQGE